MDTVPMNAVSTTSLPQRDPDPIDVGWGAISLFGRASRPQTLLYSASLAGKRIIDLTGAIGGLLALAPVLLAIAILIRADSPGPVVFRQRRLGRHGRPFWIYKFRSMRADAECQVATLEAKNEAARGLLFKMRDDPRVTRIGRFIRRTNLDELPQLVNVLKGEMSLVGPRPFQIRDCEKLKALDPTAFARRLEFPPGLTGAWQVGRASPVDSEHLLDLDLGYVDRWSLALDLQLIYRTVFIVLKGFGPQNKPQSEPRPRNVGGLETGHGPEPCCFPTDGAC